MKQISFNIILIILSFIGTLLVKFFPSILQFWLHTHFLEQQNFYPIFIQIFIANFLHGWFFHFINNAIFMYYFWNTVEQMIGTKKYIIFFLFTAIFEWILFIFFLQIPGIVIWISGFAIALLTYYTLKLHEKKHPEWKWGITAIGLNIIIGFLPWISLYWHLFGMISGIIFYYFNKDYFRKKFIWIWFLKN